MKSPVVKRSILLGGRKTSVSLEGAFWSGMKEISEERGKALYELIGEIDRKRQNSNLYSRHPRVRARPFQNLRRSPWVTHPKSSCLTITTSRGSSDACGSLP